MVGSTNRAGGGPRRAGPPVLAAAVWTAAMLISATSAPAADSAVILMYHRFGEDNYPTTNIRMDQLREQLKELTSGKYTVMPVPRIIAALRQGDALPERAVGITVDDAFKSVYTNAWPLFRDAGISFTLFVATDSIDEKLPAFMTWDQLRELRDKGVTIGAHTGGHAHLPLMRPAGSAAEIGRSMDRLQAEMGERPRLFAYPYGETSLSVKKQVTGAGVDVAFGQHSGVLFAGADMLYLPRFALNETYGSMDRFKLAVNALPLKVKDITPRETLLSPETNPPRFGFTVFGDAVRDLRALTCYASGQGKTELVRLGGQRIETRIARGFPTGRARINCTMPARNGRWRWFGMQFLVPRS